MLNSEDLAQLKIDALIKKQEQNYISNYFIDLPLNFMPRSNEQIIIQHNSNGNILSFAYSLLANIFSPKSCLSQRNSVNCPPNSKQYASRESMSPDRASGFSQISISKQFDQSCEQSSQGRQKFQRLLQLIYSKRIDLSQIINIPLNVEQALQLLSLQNYHKNMYLKKLFLQFLKILLEQHQRGPKLSQTKKKKNIVLNTLQQFPLMESIIAIFFRCFLLNDYQISQAKDYNKPISDQTVFTALCDTFSCLSLRIQQKYIELCHGNFIQFLKLKKKTNRNQTIDTQFYLISLQNCKQQTSPQKQNGAGVTFRVRRKSIEVSNAQNISFRQSSRLFSNQQSEQNKKKNQKDKDNKVQTNTTINSKADDILNLIDVEDKMNNILQKNAKFHPNSNTSIPKKEPPKTNIDDKNKNTKKLPQNETLKTKYTPELNGYTSLEILKQLNPQVRDSIIRKINHFKGHHG